MQRRRFLATAPLLAAPAAAARPAPTPAQTRGPFYPLELPLDHDNDLLQVAGRRGRARGTVTHLAGRVLDLGGRPVAGARVEIWQCDANGRYHHPWDRGGPDPDPGFQGYGSFLTGGDGGYRFRTIRPVPYPGRTPHVHFAVTPPGGETLVTQMYVRGEPGNRRDGVLARVPPHLRERLMVALEPRVDAPAELAARFDIVLPA